MLAQGLWVSLWKTVELYAGGGTCWRRGWIYVPPELHRGREQLGLLVGSSECGPHLLLLDVERWRSKVGMETVQTSHKIHWVCLRGQIPRPVSVVGHPALIFSHTVLISYDAICCFSFIAQLDSAFLIAGLSSYLTVPCLHLWKQSSRSCWEVWSLYWAGVYWERMAFHCFGGGCRGFSQLVKAAHTEHALFTIMLNKHMGFSVHDITHAHIAYVHIAIIAKIISRPHTSQRCMCRSIEC